MPKIRLQKLPRAVIEHLGLALALRAAGITVVLDALKNEEEWNQSGPNEGWLTWSYAQVEANDKVLIIATHS